MGIELAELKDRNILVELVRGHVEHVSTFTGLPVDETVFGQTADYLYTAPNAVSFVYRAEDGEIVGVLAGHVITPSMSTMRVFEELIFYFKPEHSGHSVEMIRAVKKFVADAGLDGLLMGVMSDADERIMRLYKALKMKEIERKFLWKPVK